MEKRTERRTVKHNYTNDELLFLSEDMAVKNQELRQQEDEKKSVLSQYSSHINELKESISNLATKVANRFEHREVECEVEYHKPEQDVKTLTRKDNSASWTEKMTEFDYDLFNQFNGEEGEDPKEDIDQGSYEAGMESEAAGSEETNKGTF